MTRGGLVSPSPPSTCAATSARTFLRVSARRSHAFSSTAFRVSCGIVLILHVYTNETHVQQMVIRSNVPEQIIRRPLGDTPDLFASCLRGLCECLDN